MKNKLAVAAIAASLLGLSLPAWAAGDAAAGAKVFKSQCAVCHSPLAGKNIVGPSLFGIVGRHSGSVPGFNYSEANKKSGIVWTEAELDKYIKNPQKVVPGTIMPYPGLKDATQRANLIAYLATLK